MRHGESLANQRGIIVSHACNAMDEFGLTPRGAQQAANAALASSLDKTLDQATIIFSSDYRRARETAEIAASVLKVKRKIEYSTLLRERNFGSWELQSDKHYAEVWSQDAENPSLVRNDVESVQSVANRTDVFLQSLEDRFHNQTILLVGHGDVLQILSAVQQNMQAQFHRSMAAIGNAEIRAL